MPNFLPGAPSLGALVCIRTLCSRYLVFFISPYWWCFRYIVQHLGGEFLSAIGNWLRKLDC